MSSYPAPAADESSLEHVYWRIVELRPRFPGAPLIRIRPNWREHEPPSGPAAALFRRHVTSAASVLDVGAGDRYWKSVLERMGFAGRYESADIDRRHAHEHQDFLEVQDEFEVILMLELLEHLSLDLGMRFIAHARRLLLPGGVLVMGTPNPRHAHHFFSADFTHVRPWPAHDVWAMCRVLEFDHVQVYRQMFVPGRRAVLLPAQLILSKILELDPAHSLIAFARCPDASQVGPPRLST